MILSQSMGCHKGLHKFRHQTHPLLIILTVIIVKTAITVLVAPIVRGVHIVNIVMI